jgi:5-formyltetrahydrofolate cyclo-ligase
VIPAAATSLKTEKRALRAEVVARRAAMSAEARRIASERACDHLARLLLPSPGVVTAFMSLEGEIDIGPAIAAVHRAGVPLALPVVTGKGQKLTFRHFAPGDPLAAGTWNIPEPLPEAPEAVPDVIVVPLVAFDGNGGRLGYGAGFYDRTLAFWRARKPVRAVAFAFACQAVEAVPREAHDEPLDAIVTENGVVTFRRAR